MSQLEESQLKTQAEMKEKKKALVQAMGVAEAARTEATEWKRKYDVAQEVAKANGEKLKEQRVELGSLTRDVEDAQKAEVVFLAGGDRSLSCLDVTTNLPYWTVPSGCGSRPINSLALPPAATTSDLPPEAYNLVAATSCDGGGLARIWDVRSGSPAASFASHTNRRESCSSSFSPCMRYLAVGADGPEGAAVYDLRGGRVAFEVGEGRKVKDGPVIDVRWNPVFPQLATASQSGVVKFYKEREGEVEGEGGGGG